MKSPLKIIREREKEFDEKFPYHAVEYGKDYNVVRNIFPEIKDFNNQTIIALLEAECEELENILSTTIDQNNMASAELGQHIIDLQSLIKEIKHEN